MTAAAAAGDADIAPGDDVCPTPPPVDEEPPADRFCDLVLTGGVASGVVYPWAIVELARAFRFRNIGGTSVGAMAAALAAAAEYGRSTGAPAPFELLRRLPAALGEGLPDGRTRMLSLFQANARGKRLIRLWGKLGSGQPHVGLGRVVREVLRAYALPCSVVALLLGLLGVQGDAPVLVRIVVTVLLGVGGALTGLLWAAWSDVRHGLVDNGLGLCKGGTLEPANPKGYLPGISEWMHDGIQLSAGLKKTDRPLTFRDLWNAPAYRGAAPRPCDEKDPVGRRAINLQVITTNVTHGRPYRLPLADETSRIFFNPQELKDYFPPVVLDALVKAAHPYVPRSDSDPDSVANQQDFLELPGADLPIVVAARLSLSYPLLFSAMPLWAIDYETPIREQRGLKRCQFTDGGASSNFPIHMFDDALPAWPTFGMWLDRRKPDFPDEDVWLPEFYGQGWGDSWNRFNPKSLVGFLAGIATSAVDWHDRTGFRLPHVRNRVARLLLKPGEVGLNIGMTREQILRMAYRYGTKAGQLFVQRFAEENGQPSPAWREQRWVRLVVLINGLRERLAGLSTAAQWAAHTVPMVDAIKQAALVRPIRTLGDRKKLSDAQALSLEGLLGELERLEVVLRDAEPQGFRPVPEPELRLRSSL